jgi:hypothetical protein
MTQRRLRVPLALALAGASLPVLAADDDAWHGNVAFDGWLFVLDGTVAVRDRETNVNTSFKDTADLIGHANSLLGLSGELGKGRFRFVGDGMHLDFDIPENGGEVDLTHERFDGALAYRTQGDASGADGYFDLLAGVRWFNIKLGFRGDGPLDLAVKGEQDTIQPILGFRGDHKATELIHLKYRADFGGFQRDDNSMQLYGAMSFQFQNGWFLDTGVRALSLNFDDGSGDTRFSHRVRYIGPQFGGGWRF